MHRFVLVNSVLAHELVQRLRQASIEARSAGPISGGEYGGVLHEQVFIPEDADRREAIEIYRALVRDRTDFECPRCGYDLRGSAGGAVCPECGTEVSTGRVERPCPGCGETVPTNFDACWSCGERLQP